MIPTFVTFGDSSLQNAGGYSLDLKFWWHFKWPPEIQKLTMKQYVLLVRDHLTGDIISINLLEFATAIINYASSLAAIESDPILVSADNHHPVLLNWSDNGPRTPSLLSSFFSLFLCFCFLLAGSKYTH